MSGEELFAKSWGLSLLMYCMTELRKVGGRWLKELLMGQGLSPGFSQSTVSLYMVSVSWILMSIAMLFTSPLLKPLFVL